MGLKMCGWQWRHLLFWMGFPFLPLHYSVQKKENCQFPGKQQFKQIYNQLMSGNGMKHPCKMHAESPICITSHLCLIILSPVDDGILRKDLTPASLQISTNTQTIPMKQKVRHGTLCKRVGTQFLKNGGDKKILGTAIYSGRHNKKTNRCPDHHILLASLSKSLTSVPCLLCKPQLRKVSKVSTFSRFPLVQRFFSETENIEWKFQESRPCKKTLWHANLHGNTLGCPPSQDAIVTTRITVFLGSGIPT